MLLKICSLGVKQQTFTQKIQLIIKTRHTLVLVWDNSAVSAHHEPL